MVKAAAGVIVVLCILWLVYVMTSARTVVDLVQTMEEQQGVDLVIQIRINNNTPAIEYPDSMVVSTATPGELLLPVNRAVALQLFADDVIYDFAIPEWNIDVDVLPGLKQEVTLGPLSSTEQTRRYIVRASQRQWTFPLRIEAQ